MTLASLAAGLVLYSLVTGYQVTDIREETNNGTKVITTSTKREHKIPETYLIVIGLIVAVVLAPEIRTAKVGPLEVDLTRDPAPIMP